MKNLRSNIEGFLKDNDLFTKFLVYLGFLTSGYFTWLALTSRAQLDMVKYAFTAYTLVMECGKAKIYMSHVKTGKKNSKFKTIWLVLTFFSICFSMTYFLKENNIVENQSKTSSITFNQNKDKETRLKADLNSKQQQRDLSLQEKNNASSALSLDKTDISKKTDNYNDTIKSIQGQVSKKGDELKDALHRKLVKTPAIIENEISQLKLTLNNTVTARDGLRVTDATGTAQGNVDKLNSEIKALNDQINGIDYNNIPADKATDSLLVLFQYLPFNTTAVEFIFTLALTTTFEVLICFLYTLSYQGQYEKNSYTPTHKVAGFQASAVTAKELDTTKCLSGSSTPTNLEFGKTKIENDYVSDEIPKKTIGFIAPVQVAQVSILTPPRTPKKFKIKKVPKVSPTPQNKYTGFTNKDLEKYIDYMYDNTSITKNGLESVGLTKMSKDGLLGLSYKICRAIHGYLSTLGAIETKNKSTVILKSKQELLCTINQ